VQEKRFTNGLGGAGLFRVSSFFAFRPIGSSWALAVREPAGLLGGCIAEEKPRGRARGALSLLELCGSPLFVFEIESSDVSGLSPVEETFKVLLISDKGT
jgi:hypothetical protein